MNLNLSGAPKAQTEPKTLKANMIHDVTFDNVIAEEITNKDGSQKFDVIKLKFSHVDEPLTFEDVIFAPKEDDLIRKPNNFGYNNPSSAEEMMFKVRHLINAVNPELSAQMDKKKIEFDSFKALGVFLMKHLEKSKGAKTQIKVLANKDGYAIFPRYTLGINKENNTYPKTNFIGSNLTFTAGELKKISEAASAKPTAMAKDPLESDYELPAEMVPSGMDNLNFDDIELA